MNDQLYVAVSALPARFFTRGSVVPPLTDAVYVLDAASAEPGVIVAVLEAAS